MLINNKNVIRSLYQINNNISLNNVIVIRTKINSKKQQLILLGKIYCQGFELIGLREGKRHTFFCIKKVDKPKLVEEKKYSFFSTIFIYPYCEYLTFSNITQINTKTNISLKDCYTFLGKLFNR